MARVYTQNDPESASPSHHTFLGTSAADGPNITSLSKNSKFQFLYPLEGFMQATHQTL